MKWAPVATFGVAAACADPDSYLERARATTTSHVKWTNRWSSRSQDPLLIAVGRQSPLGPSSMSVAGPTP
jgi:hypothetical protein